MSAFLREAAWRLYLLYFRPRELERQLRAGLQGQSETVSPVRLLGVVDKLDQETARRYLAQVALWCGIAAAPLLLLAPFAARPPASGILLLSYVIVWAIGLGAAVWDAPWGPGAVLFFALLLACAPEPSSWWTVIASTDNLAAIRQALWPDLPVSLGIGLVVGFWGARWHLWSKRAAGVLAGVLAGIVAGIVAGVGEVSVAVVVAFGVAFVVADEELDAASVAVIMAFIVAFGVAVGVAGVVAFGVAGDVAGVGAVVVAFVVAGVVAVGVGGSVAGSVAVGVAGVVAVGMAVGVAGVVAVGVGNLSLLPWSVLAAAALTLGMTATARRLSGRAFALRALLVIAIPVTLLWQTPLHGIIWALAGLVGLTRLPLLLAYMAYTVASEWRARQKPARVWHFWQRPPWQWDELIPLPLPRLDRLLVVAAQQDRARGVAAITDAANTWRQGSAAQSALLQLVALELGNRKSERAIAAAARDLSWLPEILPQTVKDTAGRFRAISRLVEDKLNLTDSDAQMAQLSRAVGELDNLIQGLTFVPQPERERFLPVAQAWRAVLQAATVRLPNPYVAGDPLRGGQGGLFVGREDVLRQLQSHLQDRSQRPTLVLFGQRRMGKSSLLYQLPQQFDANTIPVRVDCQAGEMQESNQAFLYNLARAIQQQARAFRQIDFPHPPSLVEMTFTMFYGWIQQIEQQLGERVLLLSLDEFESVGAAVAGGWLDERIFGFLRNLIQHHPPITLLLAGSHRPSEIGRPWSDYLISAVVLPISYLNPEETARLITQPIPGFPLRYTPQAVQHIIDLTRCQPLLVQLLCQQIVLLLNERGERAADMAEVEAAVPGALSQGGSLYFTYLREYDAGTEGEVMLRTLARKGAGAILPEQALTRDDPARGQALQRLLARDIVERVDGGIRFEVELTRRWWAEYGRGEV